MNEQGPLGTECFKEVKTDSMVMIPRFWSTGWMGVQFTSMELDYSRGDDWDGNRRNDSFCFGHVNCQITMSHPNGAVEQKLELRGEVQAGDKHLRVFIT